MMELICKLNICDSQSKPFLTFIKTQLEVRGQRAQVEFSCLDFVDTAGQ